MALKANHEFLFIGRDENSFLENYAYDLFKDYGERGGQVFVNLEVQNNAVDAEEIGAMVFETVQKLFFEDIEKEPYARFETALKAVNGMLKEFKKQKVSGYIGNLNVIISAIVGDELLLSQSGDSEAYLIRKRYVSVISDGLSEETNDDVFSSIASGRIEAGDMVLFSSTRLLRYITKTDLAKCVNKAGVAESLADIRDIVATEMLGRVGLTGMIFEKVSDSEVVELEEEMDAVSRSVAKAAEPKMNVEKENFAGKFFDKLKGSKAISKSSSKVLKGAKGLAGKLTDGIAAKGFGKDKVLASLVVLIVILVVGIFFLRQHSAQQEQIDKLDAVLVGVQEKIAEAQTQGAVDKEKAKGILDKAYNDAKSVLNSGYYRDKATIYLLQIEEARDKLDNVVRIDSPTVVADLTSKRSDVNALGFVTLGNRAFVYEYNALYELVLDQVQDPLTLDDKESVVTATGFDDRNSLVFLTKTGKLIEYKDGNVSYMDTEEGSFHKGTVLADWGNRIYILEPAAAQIWKYTYKGTQDSFGTAESYLIDKPELADARDFAIDANVYVLKATGDIFKFFGGKKVDFFINNPPASGLEDATNIYTDETLDQVFVLDAKDSKVLIFKKDTHTGDLVYEAQYLLDNVGELRDLYVDPASRTLYVLTATKVLSVNLSTGE